MPDQATEALITDEELGEVIREKGRQVRNAITVLQLILDHIPPETRRVPWNGQQDFYRGIPQPKRRQFLERLERLAARRPRLDTFSPCHDLILCRGRILRPPAGSYLAPCGSVRGRWPLSRTATLQTCNRKNGSAGAPRTFAATCPATAGPHRPRRRLPPARGAEGRRLGAHSPCARPIRAP
jgi:hypothetical protein